MPKEALQSCKEFVSRAEKLLGPAPSPISIQELTLEQAVFATTGTSTALLPALARYYQQQTSSSTNSAGGMMPQLPTKQQVSPSLLQKSRSYIATLFGK